jgi:hypothetical protein
MTSIPDTAVERAGRRALGLVIVGLGLQVGALLAWSPATFIVSAAVGVPLVLLGAGLFGRAVWRALPDDPAGLQKGPPS